MAQILIGQIDETTFAQLTDLANENHVTIEDQARKLFIEGFEMANRRRNLITLADQIASMTPKGVAQTDSTLLIREDRDR